MKTVNVGDTIEVIMEGRSAGQATLNVFHYQITAAPIGGFDWNGYADQLNVQFGNPGGFIEKYLACCSNEFTLRTLRVQAIRAVRYSYENFDKADEPGTVAEESLPPNDAIVITKRNDGTGRHSRGSFHMPGVPRTFVSNGDITAAGLAAYTAFAQEAFQVLQLTVLSGTVDLTPVIFNRSNPLTSQQWNQFIVQHTSRVQRRRTVGLGI